MIAVVDYRKGNLKSVERGLVAAGARDVAVTSDAAAIARADAIVLPGVGAFADAAATMEELGQLSVIRQRVAAGVPFLGICLGMHLMFEEGVEGVFESGDDEAAPNAKGLAILPGVVGKMPSFGADGTAFKVPHVGWNTADAPFAADDWESLGVESSEGPGEFGGDAVAGGWNCPLFEGLEPGTYFYFTHSYCAPDGPFTVATTRHSVVFPSAVQYGDVAFGVQFHPEKSSDAGAQLLRNFVRIAKEG